MSVSPISAEPRTRFVQGSVENDLWKFANGAISNAVVFELRQARSEIERLNSVLDECLRISKAALK
jgi:hypothetical protein